MTEIKVVEAAKILGRNTSTVAKMIRSGELQAKKRGKTWYLSEAYVRRFAATLPSSEEASRQNLANGRLPGKVSKPKPKPAPKVHPWETVKAAAKQTHTTDMQEAIDKYEPAHKLQMKRIEDIVFNAKRRLEAMA